MNNHNVVYVFAENMVEALNWANMNDLSDKEWVFVQNDRQLRCIYNGRYVILHGFHRHPDCELLLCMIRLRQFKQVGVGEFIE